MNTVNRISLEIYAELCAKLDGQMEDNEECLRVAEESGYSRSEWNSAHTKWQEKITDPADMGKTASRFMHLWTEAKHRLKNK